MYYVGILLGGMVHIGYICQIRAEQHLSDTRAHSFNCIHKKVMIYYTAVCYYHAMRKK